MTIDFAKKAIQERNRRKVNVVFIQSGDDGQSEKVMCQICRVYMRFVRGNTWMCTSCGDEKSQEEDNDAAGLENTFKSSPAIVSSKNRKQRDRSDFPAGSHITQDVEILPTGERTERILDDHDI
ncbi:hypothetical protein [Nitrososphaera sp.]|uniref:hypothetical protein n=1 Tax=Nitrososphaera sp. TaxID=1971748 RepID=UPI00307CD186